jgi:phosphatidylinositol alpha-mannosyltransferase
MIIGYVLDDTLDKTDGVQQAVLAIGEKMRSLGHEVHYLVTETKRTDIKNIHSLSKYLSFSFNGNSIRTPLPASKKHIKALLKEIDFDVLHVQMPYSPFLAGRVINCAPSSVRLVGTFHILPYNTASKIGTKLLGWWVARSKKKLHAALAVSEPARVFMDKDFGLKGTVLPNPVDYEFYNSFSAKSKKANKKRIVFVGRFDIRKGVRQLARAYANMPSKNDVELIMCGKGPLLEELQTYSAEKGLGIVFPGFVTEEQKAEYLASTDIAVFPSTGGESFGIVLTEAMSAGAEVVLGGNNPGYASVLSDWPETLFDPDNTQEFTDKLEQFLQDAALRRKIGVKQQQQVKGYDTGVIASRLLNEVYQ